MLFYLRLHNRDKVYSFGRTGTFFDTEEVKQIVFNINLLKIVLEFRPCFLLYPRYDFSYLNDLRTYYNGIFRLLMFVQLMSPFVNKLSKENDFRKSKTYVPRKETSAI